MTEIIETVVAFARTTNRGDTRLLRAKLFRPDDIPGPMPLLIWIHAGGFRSGTYVAPPHFRMAGVMARHGYACAFLEYRFLTRPRDLSRAAKRLLPDLIADAETHSADIRPLFDGPAAIGAMEDCAAFFTWLNLNGEAYKLSDHLLLGGSFAGAMTVLNLLFIGPYLDLNLPDIATGIALSGAFAYPSFYRPNDTRILAAHNPNDDRVPVSSIRRLARLAGPQVTYLEQDTQDHGSMRLLPGETMRNGMRRILRFDQGLPL